MHDDYWQNLIEKERASQSYIEARTFIRSFHSLTRPSLFVCSDGNKYVVKPMRGGDKRDSVVESICGHFGNRMNAPTLKPVIVNVPLELSTEIPEGTVISPGLCHATPYRDIGDRRSYSYSFEDVNRPRFASLSLFYSLVDIRNDHQFFYDLSSPDHEVYSIDHGFAFNRRVLLTSTFNGYAATGLESVIKQGASIKDEELCNIARSVSKLTRRDLAFCVAQAPDNWLTMDCRVAIVKWLERQKRSIVADLRLIGAQI